MSLCTITLYLPFFFTLEDWTKVQWCIYYLISLFSLGLGVGASHMYLLK